MVELGIPCFRWWLESEATAFKVAFAKERQCQFALVSKSIQHSFAHLLRSINGGAAEFFDVASDYLYCTTVPTCVLVPGISEQHS